MPLSPTMDSPLHFFDLSSSLSGPQSWSPNTIKTRMVLNYRRLPYSQSYSKMSDVIPICKAVGQTSAPFTFPLLALSGSLVKEGNPAFVRDSLPIALYLESAFPPNANHHPSIFPTPASHALAVAVQALVQAAMSSSFQIIMPLLPRVVPRNEEEKRWFVESRSEKFGQSILEMKGDWKAFEKAMRPIVSALEGGPDKVGPFFEGKTVAYADFILVAFLYWFKRADDETWARVRAMGGKQDVLHKVCEACEEWVDGQGTDKEWTADKAKL